MSGGRKPSKPEFPLSIFDRPITYSRAPLNAIVRSGGSVIWDGIPSETPVIPAKAGIHSVDIAFPKVCAASSAHLSQMTPVPSGRVFAVQRLIEQGSHL